ncbi:unnamed protein product [Pocillopora meandrina]|uniref:G-protein coupled receptors family 1 profile domain-containing protein n=1 Tax=Pocillopora meandrina TaxID=46732 RepID=A0AAU9Y4F9_9CNID|nr:unnamed protein product [Pocillopora meandrina]
MSVFQEHWSLCRCVRDAAYITGYVLFFSVFDDDDGHKRGQTSRPVVGTAIQTNCNFEAHVYYCNYLLGTSTRSTTAEPNKCTEHGAIQRGSIQCTVGAVSISCLLCTTMYSEYCDRSYQKYSFLLFVIYKVAIILLCFNSTLNPFLYCWKISEVRQAMKQAIREALC